MYFEIIYEKWDYDKNMNDYYEKPNSDLEASIAGNLMYWRLQENLKLWFTRENYNDQWNKTKQLHVCRSRYLKGMEHTNLGLILLQQLSYILTISKLTDNIPQ